MSVPVICGAPAFRRASHGQPKPASAFRHLPTCYGSIGTRRDSELSMQQQALSALVAWVRLERA
ncbi:hypothetical protein, partial [Devosia sp.]|uniref:hypothetical protein n=1 Tax=Devosia sp. TaxID=1871048 RepID=UPI0035B32A5B